MEHKALIAMSGGVDSSVAAWLMQKQGYDCIGVNMQLYNNETIGVQGKTCCSLEDVEDARAVAFRMGMPFYVFNFRDEFRDKVMDKFVRCYEAGLTPNPCIDCNRYLKFSHLMHRAQVLGCDTVVTGHYARITKEETTGRYLLHKAAFVEKDQSYVLYSLTQEQLAHIQFPLGELPKTKVREIAEAQGFINAKKRDSQDICFVPDGDYVAFLEQFTGKHYAPGNFLNTEGKVIGQHRGAVAYTIGQRKGLGLAMGAPVYVCGKDMSANTVTVGDNDNLFSKVLRADDWNFFPFDTLTEPMEVMAKVRYRQVEQPAVAYPEENGVVRIEFKEAQRAITTGQAVVLYQGDLVIGGGTITEVPR